MVRRSLIAVLLLVALPHEASAYRLDLELGSGYEGQGYFALLGHGWRHGPTGQLSTTLRWGQGDVSRGVRLSLHHARLLDAYRLSCALGCDAGELRHGYTVGGSVSYFKQRGRWWWSLGLALVHERVAWEIVLGEAEADDDRWPVRPELAFAGGFRQPLGAGFALQLGVELSNFLIVSTRGNATVGLSYTF